MFEASVVPILYEENKTNGDVEADIDRRERDTWSHAVDGGGDEGGSRLFGLENGEGKYEADDEHQQDQKQDNSYGNKTWAISLVGFVVCGSFCHG